MTTNTVGTNAGHGHVWERPDGAKARCGGPRMCEQCSADQLLATAATARCASCDHLVSEHDASGCWRAVVVGTVGENLVCRCSQPFPGSQVPR